MYLETVESHIESEHQEFAMDPWCSPQWVLSVHPLDEITQTAIDLRSPCPIPRFPAPISFETRTMPPQDRLPLHYLSQIEQPGQSESSRPAKPGR